MVSYQPAPVAPRIRKFEILKSDLLAYYTGKGGFKDLMCSIHGQNIFSTELRKKTVYQKK